MSTPLRQLSAAAAALGLLFWCLPGQSVAAEEGTITAFAVWQGEGRGTATGPKELTFVGALAGPGYLETE
jgi:hypothetical protein